MGADVGPGGGGDKRAGGWYADVMQTPLLRDLPFLVRLGLSALMLVLVGGMAASAAHIWFHYQNRDESKGLTMDDLRAAYHGLDRPPALLSSLRRGHPEDVKPGALTRENRETLLKWASSGRIVEDYDSIDLGASSPSEIIATSCVSCHGANGADPKAAAIRLSSLENVKKVAFGKRVNRAPVNIVAMTTHTHALSLGTMAVMLLGLLWLTRLARGLVGWLTAGLGLGLLGDIGSWWAARTSEYFVVVIAVSGAVFNGLSVLVMVVVLADMWWPRGREGG